MKRTFILSGLMGLLFVFTVGAGVTSAQGNFSGKWAIDKSRSSDIAPMTDISMTIIQSGNKVTVSHKLDTPQGVMTPRDTFVLDGSTQEIMLDGPNGSHAKGKRTAKKISGGFETSDEGTFKPERFPEAVTVTTTRKWQLSPDGNTLTLEITRASKLGTQHTKRVFSKQ